jgi:hypothetical protein
MATSTLASLKFTKAKKPTQVSPTQLRRNKLIGRLAEQIELAKALLVQHPFCNFPEH